MLTSDESDTRQLRSPLTDRKYSFPHPTPPPLLNCKAENERMCPFIQWSWQAEGERSPGAPCVLPSSLLLNNNESVASRCHDRASAVSPLTVGSFVLPQMHSPHSHEVVGLDDISGIHYTLLISVRFSQSASTLHAKAIYMHMNPRKGQNVTGSHPHLRNQDQCSVAFSLHRTRHCMCHQRYEVEIWYICRQGMGLALCNTCLVIPFIAFRTILKGLLSSV